MTQEPRLDAPEARSLSNVGELFADISRDLSTLIRQETELAKAEMRQSATKAGKGAGMLGGGRRRRSLRAALPVDRPLVGARQPDRA